MINFHVQITAIIIPRRCIYLCCSAVVIMMFSQPTQWSIHQYQLYIVISLRASFNHLMVRYTSLILSSTHLITDNTPTSIKIKNSHLINVCRLVGIVNIPCLPQSRWRDDELPVAHPYERTANIIIRHSVDSQPERQQKKYSDKGTVASPHQLKIRSHTSSWKSQNIN